MYPHPIRVGAFRADLANRRPAPFRFPIFRLNLPRSLEFASQVPYSIKKRKKTEISIPSHVRFGGPQRSTEAAPPPRSATAGCYSTILGHSS